MSVSWQNFAKISFLSFLNSAFKAEWNLIAFYELPQSGRKSWAIPFPLIPFPTGQNIKKHPAGNFFLNFLPTFFTRILSKQCEPLQVTDIYWKR